MKYKIYWDSTINCQIAKSNNENIWNYFISCSNDSWSMINLPFSKKSKVIERNVILILLSLPHVQRIFWKMKKYIFLLCFEFLSVQHYANDARNSFWFYFVFPFDIVRTVWMTLRRQNYCSIPFEGHCSYNDRNLTLSSFRVTMDSCVNAYHQKLGQSNRNSFAYNHNGILWMTSLRSPK